MGFEMSYVVELFNGDLVVHCDSDGKLEKAEGFFSWSNWPIDCTDLVLRNDKILVMIVDQRLSDLECEKENREFDDDEFQYGVCF